MNKELAKLANHLDRLGHRDLADKLDDLIRKNAGRWKSVTTEQLGEAPLYSTFTAMVDELSKISELALDADILLAQTEEKAKAAPTSLFSGSGSTSEYSEWAKLNNWATTPYSGWIPQSISGGLSVADKSEKVQELEDLAVKVYAEAQKASAPQTVAKPSVSPSAPASDNDLAKIQRIVGADPTGQWTGETQSKLEEFLVNHEEYIVPREKAMDALSWGPNAQSLGVRGGGEVGSYSGNARGLLQFLTSLKEQSGRLDSHLGEEEDEFLDPTLSSLEDAFKKLARDFSRTSGAVRR